MTQPATDTGAAWTLEPGAIVFVEDPYATGFTDDEINVILNGGTPPAITVRAYDSQGLVAAADVQTGAMIAFVPRLEDAQRLALDGGEPLDQLHCTSIYLGDAADFDDGERADVIGIITEIAPNIPPILANVFGFAILNPGGDEPCLVANVGGTDLDEAQEIIEGLADEGQFSSPEQHEPWLAHITLIYESDPRTSLTDSVLSLAGPIIFDRIRVAFGGVITDIPLGDGALLADTFHLVGKHNQQSHAHGRGQLEQVSPKKMKKRQGEYEHQVGHAKTGDAASADVGPSDAATTAALDNYAGSVGYYDVNQGLRDAHGNLGEVVQPAPLGISGNESPFHSNEELRGQISAMDAGMDAHHTTHDIVTTRVISNPDRALGSHYTDGDLAGLTWHEHGFVSTHTGGDWHSEDQIIRLHGGADNMYSNKYQKTVTMRILVPKGSHALRGRSEEKEIILDRGQTFRVVKDHGLDPKFYNTRRIDVEVVQS